MVISSPAPAPTPPTQPRNPFLNCQTIAFSASPSTLPTPRSKNPFLGTYISRYRSGLAGRHTPRLSNSRDEEPRPVSPAKIDILSSPAPSPAPIPPMLRSKNPFLNFHLLREHVRPVNQRPLQDPPTLSRLDSGPPPRPRSSNRRQNKPPHLDSSPPGPGAPRYYIAGDFTVHDRSRHVTNVDSGNTTISSINNCGCGPDDRLLITGRLFFFKPESRTRMLCFAFQLG